MQLIGKPIANSLFTFLLHMILNVAFFKHSSYKTVQGVFLKYLRERYRYLSTYGLLEFKWLFHI